MFFKNAQAYRLPANWHDTVSAADLDEKLCAKAFRPCGAMDAESRGWVSPAGEGFQHLHAAGLQWLICLQTETKLLPKSVINQEADDRAKEIAEQQGYKLGRKQLKDLREQVTAELLPKALKKRRKTFAWIDPVAGYLVIDASSTGAAEDVLEMLRMTLDSLPLALLRTQRSPASAMSDWLSAGDGPAGFTIDKDCSLCSVTEDARGVVYKNGLDDEQIRQHIAAGKLPTKLAMTFDERVSFVLTEKGEVKRLDFLDIVKEKVDATESQDAAALFDAGFAIMAGELARLLPAIVDAMGGEIERAPDLVDQAEDAAPLDAAAAPLYEDAKRAVLTSGRPSISLVQRELRIGYNHAARLLEQMERDGILTPMDSTGVRHIATKEAA